MNYLYRKEMGTRKLKPLASISMNSGLLGGTFASVFTLGLNFLWLGCEEDNECQQGTSVLRNGILDSTYSLWIVVDYSKGNLLYLCCWQLFAGGWVPRQHLGGSCGEDDGLSELVRSESAPGSPAGGWGKNRVTCPTICKFL